MACIERSPTQIAKCVALKIQPEHLRFLGLKAFKALAGQGYKPQISEIKSADEQLRGQSRINALPLAVVRKYWL